MVEETTTVQYTVKELLEGIKQKMTEDHAETKAQLNVLNEKVDTLESFRDRLLGAAIIFSIIGGGAAGTIINLLFRNGG